MLSEGSTYKTFHLKLLLFKRRRITETSKNSFQFLIAPSKIVFNLSLIRNQIVHIQMVFLSVHVMKIVLSKKVKFKKMKKVPK